MALKANWRKTEFVWTFYTNSAHQVSMYLISSQTSFFEDASRINNAPHFPPHSDERKSSQQSPVPLRAQVSSIYSNVWASRLPSIESDIRRLHGRVGMYLRPIVFPFFPLVFATETSEHGKTKFVSHSDSDCVGRQAGLKYCWNFRFWERRESFAAAAETFIPRLNLIPLPIVNSQIKSLSQNFFAPTPTIKFPSTRLCACFYERKGLSE